MVPLVSQVVKRCFTCKNYIVLEDGLGYCKLFGELYSARKDFNLCGPFGKYYEPNVKPTLLLK